MKKHLTFIALLALLLSTFSLSHAATVQIGDGTATTTWFPIYGLYDYSYTQQIYTQAQIGAGGEITKICFYYVSGAITNNKDWTIWMGHTDKTEFTGTSDWVAPTSPSLTQVFDGDVSSMLPAANNWMEITLDVPFTYNNTDNLLIAVHQHTPDYRAMTWGAFGSGANTGIYYRRDNTDFDLNNPQVANGTTGTINRIQLIFQDTVAPDAPTLVSPENGAEVMAGQALSWTLPAGSAGATGYDVYIDDIMVSNDQPDTSYPLTGMSAGSHSWYVVARNAIGTSPASETRTFEMLNGVIIGTGTANNNIPIYPWYNYSYSQAIYLQSDINIANQRIESIAFYWNGAAAGTNSCDWVVYMAHTDKTAFSGSADWVPYDQLTQVFAGALDLPATPGWVNITLQSPFVYNNTDNLLIAVDENTPGESGSSPYFHSTAVTGTRTLLYYNDSTNPDPASPPSANQRSAFANIKMMFGDLPTVPVFSLDPTEWDFGRQMINITGSKTFTIRNNGAGTLSVTGINPVTDGYFSVTDAPSWPVDLTAGQAATFNIEYTPTAVGNHSATFTITDGRATTNLTVDGECYDPTISSFPHTEDFDGDWSGAPAAPEGWTVINANNDDYTWRQGNSWITPTHSTPYAAYGTGNTDDWLITPPINLSGISVKMKWWDRVESSSRVNSYKVYVSTTTPEIASFTEELTDINCSNTAWIERELDLSAYNGQTVYVAFYQYASAATNYGFGIDDFSLEEIPTAPIFAYTPDTIDFGTARANVPTAYQDVTVTNTGIGTLELPIANVSIIGTDAAMFAFDSENLPLALAAGETGTIPVRYQPTAEGAHSATLRMLYNGTDYDVALSGNALDEFALFESFEDELFPPAGWTVYNGGGSQQWQRSTSDPRTGAAHAQLRYDNVAHDDWLITPKLAPTATNYTFSFYGTNSSTYYDERFNVLVSTTDNDISSFVAIDTNVGTGSNYYMLHSYDLSAYIGQHIYVAIQAISTNLLYLRIDDVSGPDMLPIPDIPANTDYTVGTGVTMSPSADLNVVPADASTPEIAALPGLDPAQSVFVGLTGTGIVDLTFTIDEDGTWYVMAICGGVRYQANDWPLIVSGSPQTTVIANVDFGAKAPVYIVATKGDDPTLPVELSSFNAVLTAENFVNLTWISQSETEMLGYRVYRAESNDQSTALLLTPSMIPATNTSTEQRYSLEDREVEIGNTYWYWLESVDYASSHIHGPVSMTVTGEIPPVLPTVTTMKNAYPNPFKQANSTTIDVSIKAGDSGTVTIYNILGQVVKTFKVNEGMHKLHWNGKDARGNNCGSGVYFYKLSTPSTNMTKKMVIVK